MPEWPEIETENLREGIREELERQGGGFLKRIALTTAVLAALAAIAALRAGATVNEALMLRTEAARLQRWHRRGGAVLLIRRRRDPGRGGSRPQNV